MSPGSSLEKTDMSIRLIFLHNSRQRSMLPKTSPLKCFLKMYLLFSYIQITKCEPLFAALANTKANTIPVKDGQHQVFILLYRQTVKKCAFCAVSHLSDHSDPVFEKNHRSTDSDNEEFCDSMEHLAMEEVCIMISMVLWWYLLIHNVFTVTLPLIPIQVCSFFFYKLVSASKVQSPGSGAASVKQKDLWFESSTTLNGGEDQALPGISTSQHNSSLSRRGKGESMLTLGWSNSPF